MTDKKPLMNQTIQSYTQISLNEARKYLTINKDETENNKKLLLSIFDKINKLNEVSRRLDSKIERKILEKSL
jgi:hypothetical protein